ncbi:hypothetical protein POF50_019630 [Streptomyces sp. SL13]|uniref:Uncharacterized protein n=1 Tax=Streptantibioticus silvisoli TaxID=2705255 RepID=A0AA90H5T7_9ACTN|nr:hypothetical protein [Streptantibioticus silvisoli]MDI5971513.1 hypothetical protein [Streptantibioticus silvisoli]
MDTNLIAAAVLFGPGALALPAVAAAWHRSNRHADAERAMLADLHATQRGTVTMTFKPGPGGPGQPMPLPEHVPGPPVVLRPVATAPESGPVAPVINIATRRRAA